MIDLDQRLEAAIREFWRQEGYAPTRRELMGLVGVSSSKMLDASLNRLREAGSVTWKVGVSRTLRIVDGVSV